MAQGLRAAFDQDFAQIRENLVRLSEMVDRAIDNSMRSLQQRDVVLAEYVIEADQEINDLRFEVEEACLVLIATQQPAAADLRAVVAAMNIAGGLTIVFGIALAWRMGGLSRLFGDGWGLVRASNTQPALVVRCEAATQSRVDQILDIIRTEIRTGQ